MADFDRAHDGLACPALPVFPAPVLAARADHQVRHAMLFVHRTPEQALLIADTLRPIGAGCAQGFLRGRPAPMSGFPHRKQVIRPLS